ncbi:MAG: thermonuclease family protein [Rhodospirillaceae bacterium]|nr:thermonuclease family protein [Rhodospirillaceae bacterium]
MQTIFTAIGKNNRTIWARPLFVALVVVLFASSPFSSRAQGLDSLDNQGTAKVTMVIDGDTIWLDDGRKVRLVGIQAPELSFGRSDFKPNPFGEAAKKQMATLSLGKSVTIYTGVASTDRHGRTLGHVVINDDNKTWLQGEMLRLGMAHVYTFADNRALANEMLEIEKTARKNNVGIWANNLYKIITDDASANYVGTYRLVEGKVLSAQKVGTNVYLNFGPVWRTDFTILVEKDGLALFAKNNVDPLAFQGKNVRVRGWLKNKNGPMIVATHPEQIEIIK